MESDIWLMLKGIWDFIVEYGLLGLVLSPLVAFFIPSIRKGWLRFYNKSYSRYCRELVNRFKSEEAFDNFPDLKLKANSASSSSKELSLIEILNAEDEVHIQGKPGSGKSSLVKKFLIELCSDHRFTRPKWIPVYIKYGSNDLFSEIFNSLIERDLIKNPAHFDIDWIKDQLKKERFLIIIDDVHNLLTNEAKRIESQIENLLKYKKNKFVLISRDYYSACPFQFNLYEIQGLENNRDIAEQILKVHAGEYRFERVWRHLQYGYKEELLQLYNTPQLVKLLANVFDQRKRFDDNKSFLFKRFLKSRHDEENRKPNKTLSLELKEKVLGAVAYELFMELEESAYYVPYNKFREKLTESVRKVRNRLGYSEYSIDSIMESLKEEGLLIKADENISFEHDQWQEFFAALEIHHGEKSIAPFLSKNFGIEIALFVSGFYQLEEEVRKRKFWKSFWKELVQSDFFLTKWCLNNQTSYVLEEVKKVYEDFKYSEENLIDAYTEQLSWYERVIKSHFPNLIKEFRPKNSDNTGILVEENRDGRVWYNYRSIDKNSEDRVLVFDHNEIMKKTDLPDTNEYFRQHYGIPFLRCKGGVSTLYDFSVKMAYEDVEEQLSSFIHRGDLVETELMEKEALYIEAVSLSKMLKGRQSRISNTSKQYVLSVGELLEGLDKLKSDRFHNNIKVPASTLSHGGLPKRDVDLEDFELRLKTHIQINELTVDEKLVSPNADLIKVIKNYRFRRDELTTEHKEFLIERSVTFFKEFYQNYKKVLEVNFPTAVKHFRTSFPIQVFLIRNGENKRFGERLVYFNVKGLKDPVDVKIVDEEDKESVKNKYQGYYGVGTYWGLKSFSRIEPIRNAVYAQIQDEYENLDRKNEHRVI